MPRRHRQFVSRLLRSVTLFRRLCESVSEFLAMQLSLSPANPEGGWGSALLKGVQSSNLLFGSDRCFYFKRLCCPPFCGFQSRSCAQAHPTRRIICLLLGRVFHPEINGALFAVVHRNSLATASFYGDRRLTRSSCSVMQIRVNFWWELLSRWFRRAPLCALDCHLSRKLDGCNRFFRSSQAGFNFQSKCS